MNPGTAVINPRIVVTGGRGYIGSALVRRLIETSCTLRLVSRSTIPVLPELEGNANIEHMAANLGDERAWVEIMADADAVVHLSSRTDLRAAEADPDGDERINVEPLRALVRAAKLKTVRARIVFASAVTVVGSLHTNPVDESVPSNPCSVYDRHKHAGETILRDATRSGLLRACSLRLANVYGYGSAPINSNRGILNMMIARAARGEPLTLYGDGTYVRDFIHLDDVVEAFRLAAESDRLCDGSSYVIASGRGYTLAEAFNLVAEEARRAAGRAIDIRHVAEPADLHPIERRNFVGNSSLFFGRTGWSPKVDLKQGIRDYFRQLETQSALAAGA
jgi:nucleoside-diphosphate-sugar epimerase